MRFLYRSLLAVFVAGFTLGSLTKYSTADEAQVNFNLIQQYKVAIQDPRTYNVGLGLRNKLTQDLDTVQYMRKYMPEEFYLYATRGLILRLNALREKLETANLTRVTVDREIGHPAPIKDQSIVGQNLMANQNIVANSPNNLAKVRRSLERLSNSEIHRTNGETVRNFPNNERQSNQELLERRR